MCQPSLRTARHRPGFTLIELLVAMTIMIFLATLAVLILPRMNEQQRAGKGADQLQGWFLIAKQRALRSGLPSGLRLVDTNPTNNNGLIFELQYVEQPPDYQVMVGGQPRRISIKPNPKSTANPPTDFIAVLEPANPGAADFSGGSGADKTLWPVQIGDYLEVQGGGLFHQIIAYDPTGSGNDSTTLQLAPFATSLPVNPSGNIVEPTASYRVVRAPRVLVGEEPLKLPNNVAIFKGKCQLGTAVGGGGGTIDFMFAPSGRVLSPNVDPIYLWVGDATTIDNPPYTDNQPVILSIKASTGLISLYPVDTTPSGDPYSLAKTNRSGGL
ncbi:MAG: Tfp pilus assembly protein FimT/FimU [Gemmataceae bacterium]